MRLPQMLRSNVCSNAEPCSLQLSFSQDSLIHQCCGDWNHLPCGHWVSKHHTRETSSCSCELLPSFGKSMDVFPCLASTLHLWCSSSRALLFPVKGYLICLSDSSVGLIMAGGFPPWQGKRLPFVGWRWECCNSCNSPAHFLGGEKRIKANTAFHKTGKVFQQQC